MIIGKYLLNSIINSDILMKNFDLLINQESQKEVLSKFLETNDDNQANFISPVDYDQYKGKHMKYSVKESEKEFTGLF